MNTRFHLGVLLLAANAGGAQSVPEPSSVALGLRGVPAAKTDRFCLRAARN